MTVTIRLEGMDKLEIALKDALAAVDDKKITGFLVEEVFDESQQEVPVKTGELKTSGSTRPADEGHEVVYDAEHAIWVEFGTSRMAGNPFLQRSVDADHRPALEKFLQEQLNGI
jgi:hypothetical protein